jgi:predicted ATP-binding protein involved in virulence
MQLQKLSLTNFRAFKQAEFEFKPGMNLLVGINGAGKSSVLDAIRILFSQIMPKVSNSRVKPMQFSDNDFLATPMPDAERNELAYYYRASFLSAEMELSIFNLLEDEYIEVKYLSHQRTKGYIPSKKEGDVRNQTVELTDRQLLSITDKKELAKIKMGRKFQPMVVYYSTRRSLTSMASPTLQDDSLAIRELRIAEFAKWWLAQKELAQESEKKAKYINARLEFIQSALQVFLDGCEIWPVKEPKPTLMIEKNHIPFDVRQLSDGERGILALVFDLARRISQDDREQKTKFDDLYEPIILIDELDLHLHPKWQREIAGKLTKTFPNCQFIATTHSPQIVGEVSPGNIIILEEGKPPYPPDQSLGMDTNWILEFLMGTNARNPEFEQKLNQISDLIEDNEFEKAQREIDTLKKGNLARDPELVKLQARLARFRILKEDQPEK